MANDFGIKSLGVYVPRQRMERAAIAAAHRWMAPSLKGLAKGRRAYLNWDEDAVTMAVEAGRAALGQTRDGVDALQLVSTNLPFADLQNASLAAAALRLPANLRTLDIGHSHRAATSALLDALRAADGETLLVASDAPPAKPASTAEMTNGAGAAALRLGRGETLARFLGGGSRTAPFVDHFRAEGQDYDYGWEERWIRDEGYLKIVPPVVREALSAAGVGVGDIQRLVLATPMRGVPEAVAKAIGFKGEIQDQLAEACGYAGAAHPLLMLAAALESAGAGEKILLIGFGQGCDALVIEKTAPPAKASAVAAALAEEVVSSDYLRMVAFRGGIELEWGMRAERDTKTMLSEAYRSHEQMTGFVAGRCRVCDTIQFPQLPYCVNTACNAKADFIATPLAEEPGKVLTLTADWLSYYMSPPLYVGFVQFDNGARVMMEVVDVGPEGLEVGQPVKMSYRIKELDPLRGYRRYFWKAVPIREKADA